MLRIVEIVEAWAEASHPSKERLELAKYRATICEGCEFKVEITNIFMKSLISKNSILPIFKCGACGCPLSKLVFSAKDPGDICYHNKWKK